MSRSKRLFRWIQKNLPGLVLCKDMLVVPPTEHIVRGFVLEATSQKERVYLWKVVTPLLRPIGSVILNYSDRISGTEKELYIKKDAFEQSAENIRNIISKHIRLFAKNSTSARLSPTCLLGGRRLASPGEA